MSKVSPPLAKVLLTHLDWNLQRLDEVLKQGSTEYFKSAALQRFGHTYAMAIKSIRGIGEFPDKSDEQCIELAIQNGWTENLPQWEEIIIDYNQINQKPAKQSADAVYLKLPHYQQIFKALFLHLQGPTCNNI